MPDDMKRRREIARHAYIARRGELGLTQEQVARRGDIVVRTVQNFESGKWPNARSRARLEKAVDWPPGEIDRVASGQGTDNTPLLAAIDRLQAELDQLRAEYARSQGKKVEPELNGHDGNGTHRAG